MTSVEDDSLADQADLQAGDVIESAGGLELSQRRSIDFADSGSQETRSGVAIGHSTRQRGDAVGDPLTLADLLRSENAAGRMFLRHGGESRMMVTPAFFVHARDM